MQSSKIKSLRFKEMDETAKAVNMEFIKFKELLQPFVIFDDGKTEAYYLGYLNKKIASKPLRAYFCRKVFEYLTAKSVPKSKKTLLWHTQQLPFLFEVIITIQYLHNHILDEKYDTKRENHPRVYQNLIASNILRELVFEYLETIIQKELGAAQYSLLLSSVRQLFMRVDIGQRIDKEYNNYSKWKKGLPFFTSTDSLFNPETKELIEPFIALVKEQILEKEGFVEAYFRRIYLTNVYFFECIVEIVGTQLQLPATEYLKLKKFAILYGFMLQLINDYADFAYPDDPGEIEKLKVKGKKTTDFFADLYNFNITLPLMYHLQDGGRRKIEAYLEGGKKRHKLISNYPRQIRTEIVQSGGILNTVLVSRAFAEAANRQLDPTNPMAPYFSNMCDMAFNNKFYHVFKL